MFSLSLCSSKTFVGSNWNSWSVETNWSNLEKYCDDDGACRCGQKENKRSVPDNFCYSLRNVLHVKLSIAAGRFLALSSALALGDDVCFHAWKVKGHSLNACEVTDNRKARTEGGWIRDFFLRW